MTEIRNPAFFEAPGFWISDVDEVNRFLDGLAAGTVFEVGRSQGGRPIRAAAYGKKEPIARTNGLFSAQLAGHTEDFFNPDRREKPVLLVISTIHGAEVEGCVSCLNLAQVLERGADLRGRPWPALRELASGLRVVLVPLAQPDGRVRSAVRHLVGGTQADMLYYGQGVPRGPLEEPPSWHWFLRRNPVPPGAVDVLGGYFNDAGVNLDVDDFFSPRMAPETAALLDLARAETPDCVLVLHSHGTGPWIASPNAFVPARCQFHQAQIRVLVGERHRREGLRPKAPPVVGAAEPGYFNLPTALHFVSGALPLAFEFAHGLQSYPFTFDEIVDTGLTLFEEVMRYVANARYVPGHYTHNSRGLREVPEICKRK